MNISGRFIASLSILLLNITARMRDNIAFQEQSRVYFEPVDKEASLFFCSNSNKNFSWCPMNKLFRNVFQLLGFFFLCTSTVAFAVSDDRTIKRNTDNSVQRSALVIGNSSYKDSPLKNPVNDATDIAKTLEKSGFTVKLLKNANQREMEESIRNLGKGLRTGGVGLFYFAGHGVQHQNRNYLIPVGARIDDEADVKYEAVDASLVLSKMEVAGNDVNIVILDACRNNPFARSFRSAGKGLAQMDAPTGSLVAYATAPGSVAADGKGRNGVYTKYLLQHMQQPGMTVEQTLKRVRKSVLEETEGKQTPWESSSLTGNFYFQGNGEAEEEGTSNQTEIVFWQSVAESHDRYQLNNYLDKYPNGIFVDLARRKIDALNNPSSSDTPTATARIESGNAATATKDRWSEAITTASGLKYVVIKEGRGTTPNANDMVKVHYKGTLPDGTEFDNSYKRGEPAQFKPNQTIPGWNEALQLMKVGSVLKLQIPPALAYGERGVPPVIPTNATLEFEVELLDIK